jgi:hypothetical protein
MKHSPAPIALNASSAVPLSDRPVWVRGVVFQTSEGTGGVVKFGAYSATQDDYGFFIPGGGDMYAPPLPPEAMIPLHDMRAILSSGTGELRWFAIEWTDARPPGA